MGFCAAVGINHLGQSLGWEPLLRSLSSGIQADDNAPEYCRSKKDSKGSMVAALNGSRAVTLHEIIQGITVRWWEKEQDGEDGDDAHKSG
ncbi:hypothetical protein SLA2020_443420 [Shorea laevis]